MQKRGNVDLGAKSSICIEILSKENAVGKFYNLVGNLKKHS